MARKGGGENFSRFLRGSALNVSQIARTVPLSEPFLFDQLQCKNDNCIFSSPKLTPRNSRGAGSFTLFVNQKCTMATVRQPVSLPGPRPLLTYRRALQTFISRRFLNRPRLCVPSIVPIKCTATVKDHPPTVSPTHVSEIVQQSDPTILKYQLSQGDL